MLNAIGLPAVQRLYGIKAAAVPAIVKDPTVSYAGRK